MGVDEFISTRQITEWQRGVSDYLSSLTEFVNAFDVDKLTDEQKTNALKALQKLVPPSAPATDGGVSSAVRGLLSEVKRMNNITFAGGRVVNNCMGVALFLDPDQIGDYIAKGQVRMAPLWIDPDPHTHTTPELTHSTPTVSGSAHTHSGNHGHTGSASGGAHVHGFDHYHVDNYGYVTSGPMTGAYPPGTSTTNTDSATPSISVTVNDYEGNTGEESLDELITISIQKHNAGVTGGTALVIVLVPPA